MIIKRCRIGVNGSLNNITRRTDALVDHLNVAKSDCGFTTEKDLHDQISPAPSSSTSKNVVRDISENITLRWVTGVCSFPKESMKKRQSEDANFICEDRQTIGVADGVGGWSQYGIDSGEYSRQLMSNSLLALKYEPYGGVDPQRVLDFAYSKTKALGSSTACIITLKGQSLHAVNVGDSGFRVIRNGNCIYRSPIQRSKFNCTYQLGIGSTLENPSSAQALEVGVEKGDVVVAGTDGLFDNMFDTEIEDEVRRGIREELSAEVIARRLAVLALYDSCDKFRSSPFAMEAAAAGVVHRGGKVDDITVIVAYVV